MNLIGARTTWRQRWKRKRAQDRDERLIRRAARLGCYFCALSGVREEATHGELCKRHFNETHWPPAMGPDL